MKLFVDGIVFGRQTVGGISRVWEELLKRIPDFGVTTDLLVPSATRNHSLKRLLATEKRIRILYDCFYWPSRYFERVDIRSNILKLLYVPNKTDIFHSSYFSTIYSKRIKKVITINDMIPEIFQNEYRNIWTQFGIDAKRKVLQNADAVVAISENTKKDILRVYPWVTESKISVVHLAHVQPTSRPDYQTVATKYKLDRFQRKYFLFVGNRTEYKNFDILVSFFETFPQYKKYMFVCTGPPLDAVLKRKLEHANVVDNFAFLNYVPDDELATLYSNAEAFVFPSKYEGFGLPILEAMSNKCPVICSEGSCFPEVGGNAAIYFDPNSVTSLESAVRRLFSVNRLEIIDRGRANLQRFSWEKSARELVQLYNTLA